MLKNSSLILGLLFITFFQCSQVDLDEIQGKKKKENCVTDYFGCVSYYRECIDSGRCNSSDPYYANGPEGACSSALFMCSTGSEL